MDGQIQEIRARYVGPVNSIPTTFTRDGEPDWHGIRNLIEVGITGGSGISLLTPGDSQFEFLSDSEVGQLTKTLVEQTAGRALTVAATQRWWTGRTLAFARFCRETGVDVLLMLPPQQVASAETLAAWYKAAAKEIPVMLIGIPSHDVLERLADEPRICAFKEDGTLEYAIEIQTRFPGAWEMVTGGSYRRHLAQWPYGYRAFFSWTSSFAPHIAQRYWDAVQQNDFAAARAVIATVEYPFNQLTKGNPEGWQATWRGAFELNGVAQRYLRPPRRSLTDAEMEALAAALRPLGLLGAA